MTIHKLIQSLLRNGDFEIRSHGTGWILKKINGGSEIFISNNEIQGLVALLKCAINEPIPQFVELAKEIHLT